jgi:hypothetical protein
MRVNQLVHPLSLRLLITTDIDGGIDFVVVVIMVIAIVIVAIGEVTVTTKPMILAMALVMVGLTDIFGIMGGDMDTVIDIGIIMDAIIMLITIVIGIIMAIAGIAAKFKRLSLPRLNLCL